MMNMASNIRNKASYRKQSKAYHRSKRKEKAGKGGVEQDRAGQGE